MTDEKKAQDPTITYAPLDGMTEDQEAAFHDGLADEYRAYADAIDAGTTPVRSHVQTLRLSDRESDLLRAAAGAAGVPLSAFIRQAALQAATAATAEVVWTVNPEALTRLAQTLLAATKTLQEAADEVSQPLEHHLVNQMRLGRTA